MALDPQARRAEGVSQLTSADLEGSRTNDGTGVNLPTATYNNPGPTANLRGIEPNTNWDGSTTEPMIVTNTIDGYTRDAPFVSPKDSLGDVEGPASDGWTTADSTSQNSSIPEPQVGSFTKFGEKYPGSGGLNG